SSALRAASTSSHATVSSDISRSSDVSEQSCSREKASRFVVGSTSDRRLKVSASSPANDTENPTTRVVSGSRCFMCEYLYSSPGRLRKMLPAPRVHSRRPYLSRKQPRSTMLNRNCSAASCAEKVVGSVAPGGWSNRVSDTHAVSRSGRTRNGFTFEVTAKSLVSCESSCQESYASQRQRPLLVVAVPSSWFVVGYPVGATWYCSSFPSGISYVQTLSVRFGKVTRYDREVIPPS